MEKTSYRHRYSLRPLWTECRGRYHPFKLRSGKSEVLVTVGEWAAAENLLQENLALARSPGLEAELPGACLKLADLLVLRGRAQPALQLAEEAGQIYRASGDEHGIRRFYSVMSNIYNNLADYKRSLEFLELELGLAVKHGDRKAEAEVMGNMGITYYWLGDSAKALEMLEAKRSYVEKAGNPLALGYALHIIGRVHRDNHDHARALPYLEQAQELFRATGDLRSISMALGSLAGLYYYQGQYQKALEMFTSQLAISQRMGDIYFLSCIHGDLAAVCYDKGDLEQSRMNIIKALDFARQAGDKTSIATSLYLLALLDVEAGDCAGALANFDESIEVARQTESGRFSPDYLSSKAWACYEFGLVPRAAEVCKEALAEADRFGRQDTRESVQLLADLLDHQKEPERVENKLLARAGKLKDVDKEKPEILYWLWKLGGSEEARALSLKLYTQLFARIPEHSYMKKIRDLEKNERPFLPRETR
jgi:tetratricopeptide (TPR) repeat protein